DSPGHRPPRHEPARRLLLLRHGETVYNADKRMQGQLDTDLSEAGYAQAKAVAAHLGERERDIRRIVSSDLKRAHLTAIAAGEVLGLPVEVDERLRETHLGVWQGRTHAEIDTEYEGQRARWRHDATWAPEGGDRESGGEGKRAG